MKRAVFGLMLLGLMVGCAGTRIITVDYSPRADFDALKTFQYEDSDMTVATNNPLVHDRIVAAIMNEMFALGFKEVDEYPDVYVTYYSRLDQEVRLHTTTTSMGHSSMGHSSMHRSSWYRYSSPWAWGGSISHSTTTPRTYTTGTLVIDMWKARELELVWRGTVSDLLTGDPGRDADLINRSINAVFLRFPPGP